MTATPISPNGCRLLLATETDTLWLISHQSQRNHSDTRGQSRAVLNMVHEENERFLGCPPVLEHFGGIHLVVLVILQLRDVKMM